MGKIGLLYTSHFLSTWNSRAFQFGSVLFLATLFPGTLFPVSVYALSSVLPGALWAGRFGNYIDHNNRLKVVRFSILGQRIAVILACLLFLFPIPRQSLMLAALAVLGGTENSWSIINTVSVERDWVVVVAGDDRKLLGQLNARMRSIDLACKLLGPAAIGFIDSVSHRYAIIAVLAMSLISCGVEYLAIARVYRAVPELAVKPHLEDLGPAVHEAEGRDYHDELLDSTERTALLNSPSRESKFSFWKHRLMPVSVAESLSYITVLAFSGQMIAFLLASGMPVRTVTGFRTGSVIIELGATVLAPLVIQRFGALRASCGFIDFQCVTLVVTAILFANTSQPMSSVILSLGVALSRIGLWGFDLGSQVIVQEGVEESIRGRYSAYEKSLQNWCMIFLFIFTMIFHDPRLFIWPVMLSVAATGTTMVIMNYYMYTHKGSI